MDVAESTLVQPPLLNTTPGDTQVSESNLAIVVRRKEGMRCPTTTHGKQTPVLVRVSPRLHEAASFDIHHAHTPIIRRRVEFVRSLRLPDERMDRARVYLVECDNGVVVHVWVEHPERALLVSRRHKTERGQREESNGEDTFGGHLARCTFREAERVCPMLSLGLALVLGGVGRSLGTQSSGRDGGQQLDEAVGGGLVPGDPRHFLGRSVFVFCVYLVVCDEGNVPFDSLSVPTRRRRGKPHGWLPKVWRQLCAVGCFALDAQRRPTFDGAASTACWAETTHRTRRGDRDRHRRQVQRPQHLLIAPHLGQTLELIGRGLAY
mmetsp:Transcript_6499/g.14285  ORF Transcript_6499/g.14285 Transcript_6499/m.14285 type:complete len:321 (+) Transcript_6499:33-995(+)